MKINFSDYDFAEFNIKVGVFCGIPAKLITPKEIGAKFTQKNKIFRSSVWDLEGNILSCGLKKFVNWGENPGNFLIPQSLNGCKIVEKIDGSLVIIDLVNGQLSMRTRGTFSYKGAQNFEDFEECLAESPNIEIYLRQNPHLSILCEISTPNQKIVINYGPKPQFWLIGAIDKRDYSLWRQEDLDLLGDVLLIQRPKYYTFSDIVSLLGEIEKLEGAEGCCVYSKGDQEIHKVKAAQYLILHRAKSSMNSFDKVLDLFIELKMPCYQEFYKYVETTFDYELAETAKGTMGEICALWDEACGVLRNIDLVVKSLTGKSRKDAALAIIEKYKEKQLDSFAFFALNGRALDEKSIKNLINLLKSAHA